MFCNASPLITWPKNTVCLFLIVVYVTQTLFIQAIKGFCYIHLRNHQALFHCFKEILAVSIIWTTPCWTVRQLPLHWFKWLCIDNWEFGVKLLFSAGNGLLNLNSLLEGELWAGKQPSQFKFLVRRWTAGQENSCCKFQMNVGNVYNLFEFWSSSHCFARQENSTFVFAISNKYQQQGYFEFSIRTSWTEQQSMVNCLKWILAQMWAVYQQHFSKTKCIFTFRFMPGLKTAPWPDFFTSTSPRLESNML